MSESMPRILSVVLLSGVLAVAISCNSVGTDPMGASVRSKLPYEADLSFPLETASFSYDLPRQTGGPMTVYRVPVGTMIQQYAQEYIGTAFEGGTPVEVQVGLDDYRVRDYTAFVGLSFEVKREGRIVFEQSYSAMGRRDPAPREWGGPLEGREEVNRTTDEAMRSVFAQFLNAARASHPTW